MRSASEPRDQAIQVEELNVHTRHGAAIGTPDIVSDDEVVPARMGLPERREIARIEFPGRPLALDRCRGLAPPGQDEVDLVPVLAPPIVDGASAEVGCIWFIQTQDCWRQLATRRVTAAVSPKLGQ